ncbi:hypothetical protein PMI01_01057 [Caulobacter sp. AP07]|uniref:hypothetical protein n=1 Tax=Caulobacter sp. AP07 TaxID=1144304 RepID=UPI000271DE5C|nr:hypothetical protein [Caulobacter sp. AP07]EJL36211.1 hypothetical protein PMI01_01057 [Caulobacter sp. AP07]
MAKAAAAKASGAKAPAAAASKGKTGKVAKPRTGFADFVTLMICIGCTVWAFKAIIALSSQSF